MVSKGIKWLLRCTALAGALAIVFLGTTVHSNSQSYPNDNVVPDDNVIPDDNNSDNGNGDNNSGSNNPDNNGSNNGNGNGDNNTESSNPTPPPPPPSQPSNYQYDFVSLDPGLTGNIAALGFKPTAQSLYNDATTVPEYISSLQVYTNRGQQPVNYNTEVWKSRDVQAMYGYSTNQTAAINGGVKNYILHNQLFQGQAIPALSNSVDASAREHAKSWSFSSQITDLAIKLDTAIKTKNQTSIFGPNTTGQAYANQIIDRFNKKVNVFKNALNGSNKTISFWGQSFGPVAAPSPTSFSQFSPSTKYPSWLFGPSNSLGLTPSVPKNNFKLSNNNGQIGWYANQSYDVSAVQRAFEQSSDYVVVAVKNRYYTPESIFQIKNNFLRMLKPGTATIRNVIILIEEELSLTDNNFLGMEYTMNLLARWMLSGDKASEVENNQIFNLNNLKTLSRKEYVFQSK